MSRKLFVVVSVMITLSLLLAACAKPPVPPTEAPKPPVVTEAPVATEAPVVTEAPVDPLAALLEAAKTEGVIVSYGLPDDWVNYGGMWVLYDAEFGIPHQDTDMSSGEILAAHGLAPYHPLARVEFG